MCKPLLYIFFFLFSFSLPTLAQSSQTDSAAVERGVFQLGTVTITGEKLRDSLTSLSASRIESFNRLDVSQALNLLPGIALGNVGPRNESVVYIRGFDLRQVPVFIDGIPVYVPYDGYVDLGRFTTFDLAEIRVDKGFSSVLYGPNAMGGAINLVSRRPVSKLDVQARTGIMSGEGYRWNLNVGSNLKKFYLQAGLSQLKRRFYPLPSGFDPVRFEQGGARDNSYRNDRKVSIKVGLTPNATDEYAISYQYQQGKKGNPVYAGSDPRIQQRFWQWPYWDKQSLYFISNTALGKKTYLKTRGYYDTFTNALYSYDDTTYTTQTRPYTFQSFYNDYTIGGNLEAGTRFLPKQHLKFALHAKKDVHRENNLNEPRRNFIDHTWSAGIEDVIALHDKITLTAGISYNVRNNVKAQDFDAKTQAISDFASLANDALNAQAGIFYQLHANHTLSATLERKTRFATFKDRFSYRMGTALPNPDLTAENALNYDLSYRANLAGKLALKTSFFRSNLQDVIQQVDNVAPNTFQLQNTGKALFFGAEFSVDYKVLDQVNLGVNYTYIERNNQSNPELKFTNVPVHKGFAYLNYSLPEKFNFQFSMETNSDRYSTSYGTSVGGYLLLHAKAGVRVYKFISMEAGINNMTDRNYSLIEGFPEEGRNYFVNVIFTIP